MNSRSWPFNLMDHVPPIGRHIMWIDNSCSFHYHRVPHYTNQRVIIWDKRRPTGSNGTLVLLHSIRT